MNPELQFANPVWLWIGLLICGGLVYGFVIWNRARERDLQKLAHQRLLNQLTQSYSKRKRTIKQVLWLLAVALVFIAIARPQYGFEFREVKRRGIDLVFAIDTSRSMLAEDVVPNRLERSQMAITDFVDRLEGDRIGLIPFAGKAFSLCPLTLDYSAFRQSLDVINTDIIPHQGTDLASAVDEANRLFDEEGNSHRILILITDGEDLQGAVSDAISAATEKEMTIHTIGVGDPNGSLIPITRSDGSRDFVRDDSGQPVRSALDEKTLREIAESTGGIYVPLGQAGQGLNRIYQEKLRLVPKTEMDQRLDRIPLERFEWPLAAAIILLLIEYLLNDRRSKTKRNARFKTFGRRQAGGIAGMLLVSTAFLTAAETDPRETYNQGTSAYEAGDYEKAEENLNQSLNSAIDLELQQRGYYNLGNTRFRLGQKTLETSPDETIKQWEASIKSYEDALALNADDEDASFNRDFVKKKLEELQQQQDQQQQDQQQQDQQQQDQQQQDQQQQDQQQQDQQQQDQQQQDQQQQDQQQQDQQQQDQQQQDQQQQDQQQQDQQQQDQQQQDQQPGEPQPQNPEEMGEKTPQFSEERRAPGEMSREEAAQLLEALMSDERSVIPLPDERTYRRSVPNNTTRGKTW
ncbi:MAG: VWA domain-containing protein [Verrucomicrobiales bacterium]|nr:VWA domain-containing protein [Verrucomicrobiales bacterium]